MSINFLKYRKIYFIFSGILIIGSLTSLFVFGLKPGIDFTGGSILEIEYKGERPENPKIREMLSDFNLGEITIQPAGEKGVILRMKDISEGIHQEIIQKLKTNSEVEEDPFFSTSTKASVLEELRFETIGPVIGKELKEKTNVVIILSLLAIVLYIAFAFRKLRFPAKSWQYGISSLFILSHDILIPLGIFSVLGKYYGIQITIPVIAALLTIIGYAINNVVVVYDRLRENLLRTQRLTESFEKIADLAINQTLSRQISTSLTTLFPLIFIFFLGGETLKYFALTLILGIIFGLYSSIFLAIPILVSWLKWRKKV